jgi:hypothetical protein
MVDDLFHALLLHSLTEGCAGEKARGIEGGEWGVGVVDKEWNLSAAEDDGVAAFLLEAGDDFLEGGDGFGLEDAVNEFVEDDAVDGVALIRIWPKVIDAVSGEFVWVDIAFGEPTGSRDGDAAEASRGGSGGDDLGYVQPWSWRVGEDVGQGLMDGVVRADEEVGSDGGELVGGGEHESGDGGPVVAVDGLHVLGEGVSVHGDFGVIVRAEELCAFYAYGAVAESGAFGGAGYDSYVLGHDGILASPVCLRMLAKDRAFSTAAAAPPVVEMT